MQIDRRAVLLGLAALGLAPAVLASGRQIGLPQGLPQGLPPGMRRVEADIGGERRTWYVFVPPGVSGPVPLVMALHGNGGDASVMYRRNGWAKTVQEQGWVGVFPDTGSDIEGDQVFLRHVLDRTLAEEPIDRARVHVVGFSGGGKKTYQLAAQRSDVIASIVVASSRIGHRTFEDSWSPVKNGAGPLSILHLHGLRDTVVPPDATRDPAHPDHEPVPMREGLELWARHLGARYVERPPHLPGLPAKIRVHRWQAGTGHVLLGLLDPDLTHRWADDYANRIMVAFLESTPSKSVGAPG